MRRAEIEFRGGPFGGRTTIDLDRLSSVPDPGDKPREDEPLEEFIERVRNDKPVGRQMAAEHALQLAIRERIGERVYAQCDGAGCIYEIVDYQQSGDIPLVVCRHIA